MASNTTADTSTGDLFQRKATGLLRGWSVWDAFIYATFSINLITLGLFILSYAPFVPDGALIPAVILAGLYLIFQAVTYAALIAVMPRAGGDYVWMSRILGGGIGFVLAVTGWWFILWHWVPIYADILVKEVFVPIAAIIGFDGAVTFFGQPSGVFTASVIVALLASALISLGMRSYARVQKLCFYGGLVGLAIMMIVLLVSSRADFVSAFNAEATQTLGAGGNAYQETIRAGDQAGGLPAGSGVYPTLLLIPFLAFFNLFSNWGATLYGEVRGASDFRKNIYAMGGALVVTSVTAVLMLLLFAKTFGWDFYYGSNAAFWGLVYGTIDEAPVSAWPYPALLVSFLLGNPVLQVILIALMSLWFFGWVGTVFMSSTRVVFATAFDRVLPEAVAKTSRNGVPYVALLLMLIPSIPISYFYAYGENFATWTLNATLVIALTFFGSTVAAAAFGLFLAFCLYQWITNDVYGINDPSSFLYLSTMYVLALVIYVVSRFVRRAQGMDLKMVYDEIPED